MSDAREPDVTINLKTAKKLGITVSREIIRKARIIGRE
jgi:ABC-type uncharacterized transport system substrate-binding protein